MVKRAFGLLAAGVVPIVMLSPAWADTADDQFLNAVHSQGIGGDGGALIRFAHDMCGAVGTLGALGVMGNLAVTQGLSPDQVGMVAADGIKVYCPEKTGAIPPGAIAATSGD